jgi:hypothetical protein
VQIKYYEQYEALKDLKLPFDQAVQIQNYFQHKALEDLKLPFEQAVQVESYNSLKCVEQKISTANKSICSNFVFFCKNMLSEADLLGCVTSGLSNDNGSVSSEYGIVN